MLDKTSEEWKKIPIWARSVLWLVKTRRMALRQELLVALIAALLLIFTSSTLLGAIALIIAFICAGAIKTVDNSGLWE